jgi:hypothetical protein
VCVHSALPGLYFAIRRDPTGACNWMPLARDAPMSPMPLFRRFRVGPFFTHARGIPERVTSNGSFRVFIKRFRALFHIFARFFEEFGPSGVAQVDRVSSRELETIRLDRAGDVAEWVLLGQEPQRLVRQ